MPPTRSDVLIAALDHQSERFGRVADSLDANTDAVNRLPTKTQFAAAVLVIVATVLFGSWRLNAANAQRSRAGRAFIAQQANNTEEVVVAAVTCLPTSPSQYNPATFEKDLRACIDAKLKNRGVAVERPAPTTTTVATSTTKATAKQRASPRTSRRITSTRRTSTTTGTSTTTASGGVGGPPTSRCPLPVTVPMIGCVTVPTL